VKYPDISNAIVAKKTANIAATGAGLLLAGDLGCLMNMAGKLQREGRDIEVRHVAEVLAGMTQEPAIGRPAKAEVAPAPTGARPSVRPSSNPGTKAAPKPGPNSAVAAP
jgi:hypothetical protein